MAQEPDLRRALEARVWRLAFLLSADPAAADRLAEAILRTERDLRRVPPERLDRLIILRARELGAARSREAPLSGGPPIMSDFAARAHRAVLNLAPQPREAWVLARIDSLGEIATARAMDCSRTAAARFLSQADDHLRSELGAGFEQAVGELRAAADALDPAPRVFAVRQALSRRRAMKLAIIGIALAILLLGGALAAIRLLG